MWPFGARKIAYQPNKLREFVARANQRCPNTHDMQQLEELQRQLIFVHDDMMKGRPLFDYIAETSLSGRFPIAHGYTEDKFHYWKKELGTGKSAVINPVALDQPVTGRTLYEDIPAKIWGEVYAIRPYQFEKLDFLRENGVAFERRRVKITLPIQHVMYSTKFPNPDIVEQKWRLEVWMYVGVHQYWDNLLAGVHASRPIFRKYDSRPWLGEHFRFERDR